MRDRGINNPGLKAAIAATVIVCGIVAVLWSAQGAGATPPGQGSAARVVRSLGIVTIAIAALMLLNYLYVLVLVRRMRRGDRVIGRWDLTAATLDRFRDAERVRKGRKNNWKIPRKLGAAGLPIIFSEDAVLVGNSYFPLVARGISRFGHAQIENHPVALMEFSMTVTMIAAGSQARTARYRGSLRIPIADDAGLEAAQVVGHFRQLVPG